MKKIKVTIEGECASGKTVLATELFATLTNLGFKDVKVNDIDLDPYGVRNRLADPELQAKRVKAISDREVTIDVVQLRRVTGPNPNIIRINDDPSVIRASPVSLSEGLRPSRIVLRELPGKFVTHRETMKLRVETQLIDGFRYDVVVLDHEAWDEGHYFDFSPDDPTGFANWPTKPAARENAVQSFKERANRR